MMRTLQTVRRPSPWLLAAAVALLLPGALPVQAAPAGQSAKILAAELPAGVTLAKADCGQTAKALGTAVRAHTDMAVSLTKAAVLARTPRQGDGQLACECLTKIVRAGVSAAPREASEIVQMALSLHPECADELNALLRGDRDPKDGAPSNAFDNGLNGYNTPGDFYGGFGIGFGPGFPGSPGFVGSPPSGAIALPPIALPLTPPPVTNVANG